MSGGSSSNASATRRETFDREAPDTFLDSEKGPDRTGRPAASDENRGRAECLSGSATLIKKGIGRRGGVVRPKRRSLLRMRQIGRASCRERGQSARVAVWW